MDLPPFLFGGATVRLMQCNFEMHAQAAGLGHVCSAVAKQACVTALTRRCLRDAHACTLKVEAASAPRLVVGVDGSNSCFIGLLKFVNVVVVY